ncbi:MAG: cytochrome c biogenesis protein CcsA [Candidatus Eisenbacteria bacterium]
MASREIPLLALAAVDFAASVLLLWARPRAARFVLLAGAVMLAAALAVRGITIRYAPFTQRPETMATLALAIAAVALSTWPRPPARPGSRLFGTLLLLPALALLVASIASWPAPQPPFALLVTVWYVIHVPLSFLAYGLWTAAFAASIARLAVAARSAGAGGPGAAELQAPAGVEAWDETIRSTILWGFLLFSLSMVAGGIWGYLAWGYVFLWDPKLEWSVTLWIVYAALAHLGVVRARPRLRASLAIPAWLVVWIAYLGVNLFRTSIHAFR